jgi:hypothetical protein
MGARYGRIKTTVTTSDFVSLYILFSRKSTWPGTPQVQEHLPGKPNAGGDMSTILQPEMNFYRYHIRGVKFQYSSVVNQILDEKLSVPVSRDKRLAFWICPSESRTTPDYITSVLYLGI